MPNQECKLCVGVIECISSPGQTRRLQYIPEMPFVLPKDKSVEDCPIKLNPEMHQTEINRRKLPKIKMPY